MLLLPCLTRILFPFVVQHHDAPWARGKPPPALVCCQHSSSFMYGAVMAVAIAHCCSESPTLTCSTGATRTPKASSLSRACPSVCDYLGGASGTSGPAGLS